MRVGSMTLVTLLTSEAASLVRQRSVGMVIAGDILQVCVVLYFWKEMKDFNLHRLMSGTVLPPRADESTMATFLLHLTTLLDGTNPTSRGKDLSAPILQFTS